jgi:hypothetical protein
MTAKQAKIVLGAAFALAWIVVVVVNLASTRELRREVSDLADAHSQARILGFTGAAFTGEQHVGDTMRLYESAYAAPTTVIAANTCANIDSKTIPNMSAGELAPIWQGTIFNYDAVDAAMNCDAGACSSFQTSMLAADFHGGGLCTMGGTICAGTDGGGLDQSRESWPAGGASPFGGTAHLVWSASLGEIQLQVCAGTQGVRAQGRISAIRMLRSAAVSDAGVADSGPADSGSDAADVGPIDSGAPDASDGGPPPTILAVLPNIGAGGGGEPVQFVLGAPLATATGASIGGQPATSCTWVSPSLYCTTPAYAGAPASTGQAALTVVVHTVNGDVTTPSTGFGSNLLNFVYLSTTNLKEWHTAETDSGTSIVPSRVVSGDNWVQASGSAQPAALTSFNGQSFPQTTQAALSFNADGGSQSMSMTFGAGVSPNAGGTMIVVMRAPNEEAATNIGFVIGGSSTTDWLMNWSTFGSMTWDVGNTLASVQNNTKTVDTNAHVLAGTVNGSSSIMYVDGTGTGTGTLTMTGNMTATNMLGAYPRAGPTFFAGMEYAADAIYTAPISATDSKADTCAFAYVYQTPCLLPDGGTFCSLQDGGTCL